VPTEGGSRAAPPPPTGPSPEGAQDFLNVLRRRALPAEITEEKRLQLRSVISQCVVSLYHDRIRPTQNNLQRRLREERCSDATAQAILSLCAREPDLYRILPPMHGEQPVILLLQEPAWFKGWIDVEAPVDAYGQDVWDAFNHFIHDDTLSLPGQPYQAALVLRQRLRSHAQLSLLSLGELEHIVRLSLGKLRLLSHHGDSLKPVRVVQQLAAQNRFASPKVGKETPEPTRVGKVVATPPTAVPTVTAAPKAIPEEIPQSEITDQDDAGVALLQLMRNFPEGISLSQMKHHMKAYCQRSSEEPPSFKSPKLLEVFKLMPGSQTQEQENIVKPPLAKNPVWSKNQSNHATGPGGAAAPASGVDPAAKPAVGSGPAPGLGPVINLAEATAPPSARARDGQLQSTDMAGAPGALPYPGNPFGFAAGSPLMGLGVPPPPPPQDYFGHGSGAVQSAWGARGPHHTSTIEEGNIWSGW